MKPNLHRCRLGKRIATTRTVGASVPARPPEWRRSAVDVRYVVLNDQVWLAQTNKVYTDGKGPKYGYTQDGKLAQRIWARGIVTDYSYDGWGSLTNTVYSDGTPTVTLLYDAMGRQTNAVDAAGVTSFAYDDFGSLINETVIGPAGENTIVRHWDAYGRTTGYSLVGRVATSAPQRQTAIGYDSATGRTDTMLANGSNVPFTWSYLPGSDLKSSLAYPNGLTASWTYDADGQLLQVRNATPTDVISQYDYTYDAAGRRIEIARSGSAMSETRTDSYGYNVRNELTSATKTGGPASVPATLEYAYQYDDIGNRITSTDLGTNRSYTVNSLNQYSAIMTSDSGLQTSSFTPQYDDDGNQALSQTATGTWQVQYNGENSLIPWENVSNSPIPNSSTPSLITMSFGAHSRVRKSGVRCPKSSLRHGAGTVPGEFIKKYKWLEPIANQPWNFTVFEPIPSLNLRAHQVHLAAGHSRSVFSTVKNATVHFSVYQRYWYKYSMGSKMVHVYIVDRVSFTAYSWIDKCIDENVHTFINDVFNGSLQEVTEETEFLNSDLTPFTPIYNWDFK